MTRKARADALREALGEHARIAIIGGPRTGKTTFTKSVTDRAVVHTDDFMDLDWANVPDAVIRECGKHERFVLEGVQAARTLRRGLEVDFVIYLDDAQTALNEGQERLTKGVSTVFMQWRSANRTVPVTSPDRP